MHKAYCDELLKWNVSCCSLLKANKHLKAMLPNEDYGTDPRGHVCPSFPVGTQQGTSGGM
ncbi:MAG: hypothetical protein A2830_02255 [Candidatus Taylorbacteria bacterium RIFCSPHIGHO2_01_FULL_44_110]|nr:MAG: hypothetical protein A2830_02255 [Candidatus Taylorbacteria bacterium RIFCSPHIGHO2_01_FULL_44_110]OHA39184.1 MAG: hypothetical protein A3I98_01940 [Candidatus Taylorbacteria bacterium RIFCSPLOWO2_02_FULL_45_10b]OHA45015.1 MAG: hypothetical protein A3G04_01305 [Candidatus Taylorbacteria bacterium RIFCSPLOWO2_12_FULL_44_9]